jgi:DNA-binding CsgD family transcriptional regulator
MLGRAAEAVVAADELLERPEPFSRRAVVMAHRAEALCHLGRLAAADETLRAADPILSDEWGERGESDTARAHLAFWSGRPREAVAAAEAALERPSHYAGNYLVPGLIRAWAQVDLGGRPAPPVDGGQAWASRAARAEWEALDALADGRPAVDRFESAADAWEGFMRLRSLLCRWGAGEAARRAGDASAVDRLRRALDEAEASGFEPLAARIPRSLRLAGERAVRPAPTTAVRWLLTPREREILDLVAAGRSNAEIGRQMGLGRGTVIRVLSSAMGKLGATSRAQAVTLAAGTE